MVAQVKPKDSSVEHFVGEVLLARHQGKEDGALCYHGSYDMDVCLGELVRNCCVNLGIDPDTHDGVTHNILVYRLPDNHGNKEVAGQVHTNWGTAPGLLSYLWSYVPSQSFGCACGEAHTLHIVIEEK